MKDPIDIKIPENVVLENGSMFMRMKTLEELDAFWKENKDRFPFAARGMYHPDGSTFLSEYEWVFGPSKVAVVETTLRWKEIGIKAEFNTSHGGWWTLVNLPYEMEVWDLIADGYPEFQDPNLSRDVVESSYKESVFDLTYDTADYEFLTKEAVTEYIEQNYEYKNTLDDYYGVENEAR